MRCVVLMLALLLGKLDLSADTLSPRSKKFILSSSTSVLTVGSLAALDHAWYSQYHTGTFHLFNDSQEWLQMDKAGHLYTSYQTSRLMMQAFSWARFSRPTQLFVGGSIGFIYMSAVEVMDGFSRGWGFSWADQLNNLVGAGMAIGQQAAWNEQRFQVKFSYAESGLARYNPALLGDSKPARILKDYNAQKYWLSFSPFMASTSPLIPKWLNLSLGYGAFGMLGGHGNNIIVRDEHGNQVHYERVRRYFLSLDLDLNSIPVKRKWLKGVLSVINVIKIPAPALEYSNGRFTFHYFLL